MIATRSAPAAARPFARLAAGLALAAAVGLATPAAALEGATLKATYSISISGFTVGRATAESTFNGREYDARINGSTSGLTRIVSDAKASLGGKGRIVGKNVLPGTYVLDTSEGGFQTEVRMTMRGGSITKLTAEPKLVEADDRVPVTPAHKRGVVDPLGAFVVTTDKPGLPANGKACNRTMRVFDGWQRFDIRLSYKGVKTVTGHDDSYSGDVLVCSARYVPVAGHRAERDSVKDMIDNKRMEVWLAPVANAPVLVPYRLMIGTKMGDLVISATSFVAKPTERRAAAIQ